MQLFEYAVISLPTDDNGKIIKADAKVITEPTTMLAASATDVEKTVLLALAQPELDGAFVHVLVRPFGEMARLR